jgi:hypothetical protein
MSELSKGTRGSLAELRVAVNLIAAGWSVHKNLSMNGPVDLCATRGSAVLRIQVKSTLSLNSFKNLRQSGCELLAVLVEGEIRYKAISRRVMRLVPGSVLARRPKKT